MEVIEMCTLLRSYVRRILCFSCGSLWNSYITLH